MMKNWLLISNQSNLFQGRLLKSILRKSRKEDSLVSHLELKKNIGILMLRRKYSNVETNLVMIKEINSMFFIRFGSEEGCLLSSRSKKEI